MSTIHVLRLSPGADLKFSILQYAREQLIGAGWIMTCVGSLKTVVLRFANMPSGQKLNGYFEMIALSGTISTNGCHLHCSISDKKGKMTGGHLMEGSIVYTTAEIVLGESKMHVFSREVDLETGFRELKIKNSQ